MKIIRFFRKIITKNCPVFASKIMYIKIMKKGLSLKKPQTFNEKINYLKLFVYPFDKKVIKCTDKLLVRDYIHEKQLDKYLVHLYDSWDSVDEIDWNTLPESFVLKCNHGCGYNIICSDKSKLDIEYSKKQLKKWMNEDFGNVSGEKHYSRINRKIICEEYLGDNIKDYKFFCFKGEPLFFYISQNVNGDFHDMQADFFYIDGKKADFERTDHKHFATEPKIPNNLKEMINICEKLAAEFEFVRVDLYNIDEKIIFSELTFTPCAGFMPIKPQKYDLLYGNKIDLTEKKRVLYFGSMGYISGRLDGVTIKSRVLKDYLENCNIILNTIDVDNYKQKFFSIIKSFFAYYKKTDKIVICSSSPGASILLRFLYFIKNKKKIYYFVAGSLLDKLIMEKKYNIKWYLGLEKIYVESKNMKERFDTLGFNNVIYLENFRNPKLILKKPTNVGNIIRFVFYGRMIEKKGVEDAINLIKKLSDNKYNVSLDMYGQITDDYLQRIMNSIKDSNFIHYKGAINPDGYIEYKILKEYDVFLFPTHFYEEGLPGSLIDSYLSGLCVIGSNWRNAKEYIKKETGIIYEFENFNDLYKKTEELIKSDKIMSLKTNSLKESKKFIINEVLSDFKDEIIK